jgi:hypothetical protein
VDLGIGTTALLNGRLGLALCARNLGIMGGFREGYGWLPGDLGAGIAWVMRPVGFLRCGIETDVRWYPGYPRIEISAGTELEAGLLRDVRTALRAGWTYSDGGTAASGPSVGGGFSYRRFSIDYALASGGELGATHTVSVSVRGF